MVEPRSTRRVGAVTDFSRREAAARAGIDQETLDEVVMLGIVQPGDGDRFSEGTVRKLGLVGTLLAGGIPAPAIAGELRSGRFSLAFLDNASFGTFTAISAFSFEDVARERDIPIDVLLAIREAIGAAIARPSDRMWDVELEIVPNIEAQLASGFPPDAVERASRG